MGLFESRVSRRKFLKQGGLAAAGAATLPASLSAQSQPHTQGRRPNIILFVADQFRADFVGALGENPSTRTPVLDGMAGRGTLFRSAVTNQPVCSPSELGFPKFTR